MLVHDLLLYEMLSRHLIQKVMDQHHRTLSWSLFYRRNIQALGRTVAASYVAVTAPALLGTAPRCRGGK